MRAGFLVYSLFLILFINAVSAVAFTASSNPTGLNAGQSSQLLNFTVSNIGSVNVTQLNITLFPTFTFTGSSSTTTSSPYTASSSSPSWINSSSIGIVGNGATQYFSVYVNTPSATGNYGFNISTLDASGTFNSSNVTVEIFDTLAPTYSSNTTSPSDNSTYAVNQSYWFNITWSDGLGISTVLIEHNLTGSSTIHNDTMSNSSNVYYLNTTDLSAGTYVWRVYANDTNNTFNSTSQFMYNISKASNVLNVYLNDSKNRNITSINNTAVNLVVNSSCMQSDCNITIVKDGGTTLISGGPNPYSTSDVITATGLHNYSVTVTTNTNYTSNTSRYFVATTPSYTTSSSTELTYSNTTLGGINLTFATNPQLVTAQIEGDWSGTATNYTMSNHSLTNYYFSAVLPAGTISWKMFATYLNHSFNLTTLTSFTINKASPTIALSATPQWTLETPVQTNVTCTMTTVGPTLTLYRNGTSLASPDVQTFAAGSIYEYLCNNTVTQNYTASTAKNTLVIKPKPSSTLTFVDVTSPIQVVQDSSVTAEIKVKNIGNAGQNVTFEISDMDSSWYSITPTTSNIVADTTATFKVVFTVGIVDVKDYAGKFSVTSTNGTTTQNFVLRVLPSEEMKVKINDTLALYKLDLSKLESKFEGLKTGTNDTATAGEKLNELKAAVTQAEDYINAGDYFQAQQTFGTIAALIAEVNDQLTASVAAKGFEIPATVWLVVIGTIGVIVIGALAYLFWPTKRGYKSDTGEFVYGGGQKKPGLLDTVKSLLSKLKRKKKAVAAPQK